MLYGMELWNRADGGNAEEWARVRALGGGCIKARAYHPTSILAEAKPKLVLLRRSADGEIWPSGQVEEARGWIEECQRQNVKCIYILSNEDNREGSHYRSLGPACISQYFADLGRLIEAMRAAYPDLALCSPPMAVMQDDLVWIDNIESLMRALSVEYRGAHIYWQYGMWCDQAWGKRIDCYQAHLRGQKWIVDEVADATPNRSAGERATTTLYVLDYLARNRAVEAAAIFIAGGTFQWADFWLPSQELGNIGRTLKNLYGGKPVADPRIAPPPKGDDMGEIEIQQVREYADLIVRESNLVEVAPSLTAAVMLQESGGNPLAESAMNYDAATGEPIGMAKGLMQVMPFWFKAGEDPFDPIISIRKGVQILREKYEQWGTWRQAVAAYFGAIDKHGNITEATDVTGMSGTGYVALAFANQESFLDMDEVPTAVIIDKAKTLAALDTLWGLSQSMEKQAAQVRDYVVMVKKAVGLEVA